MRDDREREYEAQWDDAHRQHAADVGDAADLAQLVAYWADLQQNQRDWQAATERMPLALRAVRLRNEWGAIRVAQALETGQLSPVAIQRLSDALISRVRWQDAAEGALRAGASDYHDQAAEATTGALYETHLAWLRRQQQEGE